jgi:hypothetical protein
MRGQTQTIVVRSSRLSPGATLGLTAAFLAVCFAGGKYIIDQSTANQDTGNISALTPDGCGAITGRLDNDLAFSAIGSTAKAIEQDANEGLRVQLGLATVDLPPPCHKVIVTKEVINGTIHYHTNERAIRLATSVTLRPLAQPSSP